MPFLYMTAALNYSSVFVMSPSIFFFSFSGTFFSHITCTGKIECLCVQNSLEISIDNKTEILSFSLFC